MVKKSIIHHPGKILREEFLIPAQITPPAISSSCWCFKQGDKSTN